MLLKYKYKLHPDSYALGENEKFYSDMEAAGWRLVKRGSYLSKFEPVEPSAARYRIEVMSNKFMEEPGMSDEQVAVYADCGWEYVTYSGMLHIFRAPAGSDAPEFYADPRQQAATLKGLRRSYLLAWLPPVVILAWNLSLHLALKGSVSQVLTEAVADWQLMWVRYTAFCLALVALLVWTLYNMIRGAWHITRTYRRMKKGIALDHEPKNRDLVHKMINRSLWVVIGILTLMYVGQWIAVDTRPLPMEADGPYLLLTDMGYAGERTYLVYSDNESEVEYSRSLLAEIWLAKEALGQPNSTTVWIYQDMYRLKDPDMAEGFVRTLMGTATFGSGPEEFTPMDAPGLDGAWTSHGLEIIACKGSMVAYITCSGSNVDHAAMLQRTLAALAEKWK